MYVLIHQIQQLEAYWKKTVFKSSCFLKNIFLVVVFLIKILQAKADFFSIKLYQNRTPLHIAGKYFPETPLEAPQVMWCIYREKYFNFSQILVVLHRKTHNLWSVSDYYFSALNGNNALCISSI